MPERQTTSTVLLIRPRRFGYNRETARTNAFQHEHTSHDPADVHQRAAREFDDFVALLQRHDVRTVVHDGAAHPDTPDAAFPNNWVSFHADATVTFYPMLAPSRRTEVRPELIDRIESDLGVCWTRRVDLTPLADQGAFLEGTGSVVLDRPRRLAFACHSPRTTNAGLAAFADSLGYEIVEFYAIDPKGSPCYHTNVMMAIGDRFATVCFDCIPDIAHRNLVRDRLESAGHEIIEITVAQRDRFAGNILALNSEADQPIIALSRQALQSLDPDQVRSLERHATLVAGPLDTIEAIGGGSARCMLAEIHLPDPTLTKPD